MASGRRRRSDAEELSTSGNVFAIMRRATSSENLLALLWRERTEVRVAPVDFALTLALSRKRAREKKYGIGI